MARPKWLLDEMLPPVTCDELRTRGYDAVSVHEVGLRGVEDAAVFDLAVRDVRVIVTENFADFAALLEQHAARGEPCVPVVFVRKRELPRRGALALHLARRLDQWAQGNVEPYVGAHWL
jgi:predicted nuclease of predicted toxin-antitoxin system